MDAFEAEDLEARISTVIQKELRRIKTKDEDLFQEVWSVLLSRWPRVTGAYDQRRGSWDSWLKTIIHNILIDCVRGSRSKLTRILSEEELRALVDHRSLTANDEEERHALAVLVEAALKELSTRVAPSNFDLLHLYLIEGKSACAIAKLVDMPREKVRKHLERMLAKLKRVVSKRLRLEVTDCDRTMRIRKRGGGEADFERIECLEG
jgi:RNA polymerase sigma factor (sigma-70 family)